MVGRVVAGGYPALKLHVSGDPGLDVSRVGEVRRAFPELGLIVDAESVYDRAGAARVGRALDGLDVHWFEAPLPDRDLDGYRELTRSLRTRMVPAGPVEPRAFGTTTHIAVVDGVVHANNDPGLGMKLDRDAIDDATVGRFTTSIG